MSRNYVSQDSGHCFCIYSDNVACEEVPGVNIHCCDNCNVSPWCVIEGYYVHLEGIFESHCHLRYIYQWWCGDRAVNVFFSVWIHSVHSEMCQYSFKAKPGKLYSSRQCCINLAMPGCFINNPCWCWINSFNYSGSRTLSTSPSRNLCSTVCREFHLRCLFCPLQQGTLLFCSCHSIVGFREVLSGF